MGPPARSEECAYLNLYVTDEQRRRRPIFNATLRAAAGWLFFRIARSSRIDSDMLVARALKNSQLTCGGVIIICETVHWAHLPNRCPISLIFLRTLPRRSLPEQKTSPTQFVQCCKRSVYRPFELPPVRPTCSILMSCFLL